MISKKRTTSALFALVAGCTVLALAALPALADPGKGQGQDKRNEQAAPQSENAGSEGESSGQSAASSKENNGKGQAKKSGSGSTTSGSGSTASKGSGSSENSANTPAPEGSTTGKPAQGCDQADAGYTHNYASTCDGSPSLNGNGGGKATGKPCAGCVGAADNKNPKGQFPDGSDHNNGYECDGNNGIGKTNPAHTGCQPTTSTTPPPPPCPEGTTLVDGRCVLVVEQPSCPEGTSMVDGRCVPDVVLPEVLCPEGTEMVGDVCLRPDEVRDFGIERQERGPRVLGAVLPFTGASALSFLGLGLGMVGAGTLALGSRRKRR